MKDSVYNLHEYSFMPLKRQIFLGPSIYANEGEDDVNRITAIELIRSLRYLDLRNENPIVIHMLITGGDCPAGMAMYDAIKACRSHVTIIAYAHARSMSSIILQAADERILMPNCEVLIHRGWLEITDRLTPALSGLEREKQLEKECLEMFAERCQAGPKFKGWSKKRIITFMMKMLDTKVDWIMSATEAIEFGFADKVLE